MAMKKSICRTLTHIDVAARSSVHLHAPIAKSFSTPTPVLNSYRHRSQMSGNPVYRDLTGCGEIPGSAILSACLGKEFCEGRTFVPHGLFLRCLAECQARILKFRRLSSEAILVNLECPNFRFQRGPRDP